MQQFNVKSVSSVAAAEDAKGRYAVQRLHFPRPGFPKQLYFRYLRDGMEDLALLEFGTGLQEIKRNDVLSTNTYFNSFYEAYWSEHTELADIALKVRFTGRLTVRGFRETKDIGCTPILTKTITSDQPKVDVISPGKIIPPEGGEAANGKQRTDLEPEARAKRSAAARNAAALLASSYATDEFSLYEPLGEGTGGAPGESIDKAPKADEISTAWLRLERLTRTQLRVPRGRIFFDLLAEEDSEVHELTLVTTAPPKQGVRLSIGLCTFSREEYLADTLAEISSAPGLDGKLTEVIVVNQGPSFKSADVSETLARDTRFRVIEQPNYGGCGGFTRTLLEAQASPAGNTHHLMMDDDVVIDNRVLETCISFLGYVREPLVLGGHMLDTFRPSVIYEAGAFLKPNNRIVPYAHNADMADPVALASFSTLVRADYNAWWFCVLPIAKTREIDYPAPIFIRGDDFEYGQRLAKAGVPTVSMPGIAVWHEPFYAKPPGWQQYYDLRNRLIFAACYPEKVTLDRPIDILGDYFLEPLLKHNYQLAALNMQAVEDFLDGPAKLFAKRPDEKHKEINALSTRYPVRKLSREVAEALPSANKRRKPIGMRRKIAAYCSRIATASLLPASSRLQLFTNAQEAHPVAIGNRCYVLANISRTIFLEYRPDRKKLREGLFLARKLLWRYASESNAAAESWSSGIHKWHSREVWEGLYGLAANPTRMTRSTENGSKSGSTLMRSQGTSR